LSLNFFKLEENKTNFKTEILAGLTTFLTMAYILIVNPLILGDAGMDIGSVFMATAISSAVATFVMAFAANLPIALAPGMGLNAFFAYTVVIGMGFSWQMALAAVFIEGLIFIALSIFDVRETIVNSIPINIKRAISVGIGLFIAFIGLKNAGIVVSYPATIIALGDMTSGGALLGMIGLFVTGTLLALKVKGAILLGILATTILGIPLGITSLPSGSWLPPSIAPTFAQFDFSTLFTFDMLIVIATFLFVDIFDTAGTLIGVATKGNLLDKEGKIPKAKQALLADAIGTTIGGLLGTSTVTSYIESASGMSEGGKTGLTSLTVGVLFILSIFLSPLFLMVPSAATASALVVVGLFMASTITSINFSDYTESIPAFMTMIMMPLTFSISEGIMFGVVSYVALKLMTGKHQEVSKVSYVLAALFVLWFGFA
jgi:AGZA family xanthine/uracil permease-like MFS transporter